MLTIEVHAGCNADMRKLRLAARKLGFSKSISGIISNVREYATAGSIIDMGLKASYVLRIRVVA